MIETALALLAAHAIADFLLQIRWIIENKRRLKAFLTHVAIVAATAVLLLGAWSPAAVTAVTIITVSHALIDWAKLWQSRKPWVREHPRGELILFLVDQLLHILVIVLTAWYLREAWNEGWWSTLPAQSQKQFLIVLAVSTGFILTTRTGSFVIRFQYAKERSHSETVIIGTLASFGWAIVVSWATTKAIGVVR